ncbi:MAG: PDZ domain-containing protein [Acidobacteria bacterium]|nr:PDZ domain-containing protein [Acidobacteriota bacterium]
MRSAGAVEREERVNWRGGPRRITALPAALAVAIGCTAPLATAPASASGREECVEERVVVFTVGARSEEKPQRERCNQTPRECVEYMSRKMRASGWVGVELKFNGRTFTIQRVIVGSPAKQAGLKVGDLLLAIDGVPAREVANRMASGRNAPRWKPGQPIKYKIEREGRGRTIEIEMARMPAHVLARYIGQHLIDYEHEDEKHDGADH